MEAEPAEGDVPMRQMLMFVLLFLLVPASAPGEIQTVTHTVRQVFGGSQSPDDARIAAVAKAKREALEMAGTYIESRTVVKDARVASDEIIALSAGVLRAEVVSQKNFVTGEAFGIEVAVRVDVDTSALDERLKRMLEDRGYLEQLTRTRAREKQLLEQVASLERENARLKEADRKDRGLEKQFHAAARNLAAVAALEQALAMRKLAERDLSRVRDLYQAGLMTSSQYQESRSRYEEADASVNRAESALRQ